MQRFTMLARRLVDLVVLGLALLTLSTTPTTAGSPVVEGSVSGHATRR